MRNEAKWRAASESGRQQYRAAFEDVRQKAARQGKWLSHRDAQQQASELYWRRKTKADEVSHQDQPIPPDYGPTNAALVDVLAEIIERPLAERIVLIIPVISDMIAAAIIPVINDGIKARDARRAPTSRSNADIPENRDQLIDVKRLADLLLVSERLVWRMSEEDPSFPKKIQIGTRVRWLMREVKTWIEKQQADSGSNPGDTRP